MAKSNTKHRVCSRESSVSSLLASCSLSGSHSSNSDGSFQYKDKLYSSASQALQAYIDDFDLSRMCPGVTTGKMNIDKCPANVPEFSSYVYKPNNAFENVDHRKSSLSSRRRTTNDIDSISLTTDDLLKLPADGSFPFTCVGPGHRSSKKTKRGVGRLGSVDTEKNQHFQEPSIAMSKDSLANTNGNGKQSRRLKNLKLVNNTNKCVSGPSLSFSKKSSFKDSSEHNLEKNYPRWLTGQKSDLNVSGITSIPDFKYPVWLHNQDLLPDANSQRIHKIFKEEQGSPRHSYQAQRTSRLTSKLDCFEYSFEPSNTVDFLSGDKGLGNEYKCDSEHSQCQCENPLLPGQSEKPFSGDKIELLILKAKRNLQHCTEELPKPMKQDDSPCSLDKLEAERSWENIPVTFKSPVPVDSEEGPQQASRAKCDKRLLEDFLNDDNQASHLLVSLGHAGRRVVLGHTLNMQTLTTTDEQKQILVKFTTDLSALYKIVQQVLDSLKRILTSYVAKYCCLLWIQSCTLSGGKHHGPVEALKQMLFNLQAVQESFNQSKTTEPKGEIKQVSEDDFSKLQLKESMVPITRSLQKALHHLSRLRDLVDDTSGKQSPKM